MTQEDKELLLRDLCARLPYNVKAYVKHWAKLDRKYYEGVYTVESIHPSLNNILVYSERFAVDVLVGYYDYEIKPYLFPLSSMTETQKEEYAHILVMSSNLASSQLLGMTVEDWLNKNHFDYRGLIEKGLAIDATRQNVY